MSESAPTSVLPNLTLPEAFTYLLEPARYKIGYGGRGAAKSWSYGQALAALSTLYNPGYSRNQINDICGQFTESTGLNSGTIRLFLSHRPLIVCGREVQKSIADSVHRIISDQIDRLGIRSMFKINRDNIEGSNGAEFIFVGLFRNVHNIKSLEGCTVCWLEEAEKLSFDTYRALRPTVRLDAGAQFVGTPEYWESEFWISFNTKYEDDPTYELMVKDPPKNSSVHLINWEQNPFFPQVLLAEKDDDYAKRPHEAPNIWEGKPLGYGRRVWPEFRPDIHIREWPMQAIVEKAQFFQAIDPAKHYYPASIWIARWPKKSGKGFIHWVYAEWPTRAEIHDDFINIRRSLLYTDTMLNMSKAFMVKDGKAEWDIDVRLRFTDTRYVHGSGAGDFVHGELSGWVEQFSKKENGGLIFRCPKEARITAASGLIHSALQYDTLVPLSDNNEPSLFIAPWCKNIIQSMSHHRLEEDSEYEAQKYKDFSDALKIGFAGMQGVPYERPVKIEPVEEFNESNPIGSVSGSDCFM